MPQQSPKWPANAEDKNRGWSAYDLKSVMVILGLHTGVNQNIGYEPDDNEYIMGRALELIDKGLQAEKAFQAGNAG